MESIVAQAVPLIEENAKTEKLEEDWIAHVFKQCDTVSDKEMQSLWAKLIAGEANNTGSFSKRTVNLIADLDKKDAHLFTSFVQFCWMVGNTLTPFIYDYDNEIISKPGINFTSLRHLETLGLISFEAHSSFAKLNLPRYQTLFYFGKPSVIEFSQDLDNTLDYGKVMISQTGIELASLCGAKRNENFYQYTIKNWCQKGLVVQSIITT